MSMKPCPGCAAAVNATDETCHSCGRNLSWGGGLFGSKNARNQSRRSGLSPRKRAHPRHGVPSQEALPDTSPADPGKHPPETPKPPHSAASPHRLVPVPRHGDGAQAPTHRHPQTASPPVAYASLSAVMIALIILAPFPFALVTLQKKYSPRARLLTGAYFSIMFLLPVLLGILAVVLS